jgi:hypothetical protein
MRNKPQETHVRCYRCDGVMVYEKFYGDYEHFFGWRCISCGEIVDPVMLENRNRSYRTRERPRVHFGRIVAHSFWGFGI